MQDAACDIPHCPSYANAGKLVRILPLRVSLASLPCWQHNGVESTKAMVHNLLDLMDLWSKNWNHHEPHAMTTVGGLISPQSGGLWETSTKWALPHGLHEKVENRPPTVACNFATFSIIHEEASPKWDYKNSLYECTSCCWSFSVSCGQSVLSPLWLSITEFLFSKMLEVIKGYFFPRPHRQVLRISQTMWSWDHRLQTSILKLQEMCKTAVFVSLLILILPPLKHIFKGRCIPDIGLQTFIKLHNFLRLIHSAHNS